MHIKHKIFKTHSKSPKIFHFRLTNRMLASYFTLVLRTPHSSKVWHTLKLSRYLFRGEFLAKILNAFFCPQHVYIQTSFDPPWFNRCNKVNKVVQCVSPFSCLHPPDISLSSFSSFLPTAMSYPYSSRPNFQPT